MMNTYLRTMEFEIDGKVVKTESWTILIDENEAILSGKTKGEGRTFDSLWDFMYEHGLIIPGNGWTRAFWSNKRRIEFFIKVKTWVDNGTERPWKVTYIDEPYRVTMERLLKFDSDDVVKYLNERNLKIGVDI